MARNKVTYNTLKRRREIARLLLLHHSQREIAEHFKVDPALICREVKMIKQQWLDERLRDFDELVAEQDARLRYMEDMLWERVESGDTHAVDRCINIMKRRAALLGLDRPERKEISLADLNRDLATTRAEIERASESETNDNSEAESPTDEVPE